MVVVYVLDVEEFRPAVDFARDGGDCKITKYEKGYYRIESSSEIALNRKAMKMKPAVWYGLFTGGLNAKFENSAAKKCASLGQTSPSSRFELFWGD